MKSLEKLNLKLSTSTHKFNSPLFKTPIEKNMGQKLREKIHYPKRQEICGKYQKEPGYLNLTSSNRRKSLDYLGQIPFQSTNLNNKGCFINYNRMASSSKNKYYQFKRDSIKTQPKIKEAITKIDVLLSKLNKQKRNLNNPNLVHIQKSNKLVLKQSINTTHSQNNQFEQVQHEQNLAAQLLEAKARLAVSNYYALDSTQVQSQQPFLTKDELSQLPTVKYQGAPTSCAVCLQQIKHGDEVTFIMCMHFVHPNCCQDWLSRSTKCPLCQIDIKKQLK